MKNKIILEIPEEYKEEVIHLLRVALSNEAVSNDVWTLLMPFCEEHSSIKFTGREKDFLNYK